MMDDEDSDEYSAQVIEIEPPETPAARYEQQKLSSNGRGGAVSGGDNDDNPEFCDVCSMELINHPDEMPCPPHEGYVKEYSMCPVCCRSQPTREHVATHFMQELLEVVREFETPLTCEGCEDYTTETEKTLALHLALSHSGTSPYLQDKQLLSRKRRAAGVIDRQEAANITHTSRPVPQPILQVHQAGDRERIKCDYCDVLFTRKDSKKKHIKRFHSALVNSEQQQQLQQSSPASNFIPAQNLAMNGGGEFDRDSQLGNECPVCTHPLTPAREKDHIIWHFIHELRELVGSTCEENNDGEFECNECSFLGNSIDSMAKHCALFHGKLDILLGDEMLMSEKRRRCLSTQRKKNSKRISNELCPICDFKDPSR